MIRSGVLAEALERPRDLERPVSYVLVSIHSSSVPLIHFDFEEDLAWVPCRGGANSLHELEGLPVREASVIETSLDEKRWVALCLHMSAYVSVRQRTSAYVRIRQHTSAHVSTRQHRAGLA